MTVQVALDSAGRRARGGLVYADTASLASPAIHAECRMFEKPVVFNFCLFSKYHSSIVRLVHGELRVFQVAQTKHINDAK